MISIGVIGLLVATIEHRRDVQELRKQYGQVRYSLATALAALMAGLRILGLISVLFRL